MKRNSVKQEKVRTTYCGTSLDIEGSYQEEALARIDIPKAAAGH